MTELQWLIKMLTQQKLPKGIKDLFIERLGEVEAGLVTRPQGRPPLPIVQAQAPSTQRLMEQHVDETQHLAVQNVAVTPAAAQALQQRQMAIQVAASGKPEPGRMNPRKF